MKKKKIKRKRKRKRNMANLSIRNGVQLASKRFTPTGFSLLYPHSLSTSHPTQIQLTLYSEKYFDFIMINLDDFYFGF